jgi:DNA-binding LacI/PurR family transcriptional regulator
VPFGEIALVPLTSVDGAGLLIGQRSMALLIDRIESGVKRTANTIYILEPRLHIRRSCGCHFGREMT